MERSRKLRRSGSRQARRIQVGGAKPRKYAIAAKRAKTCGSPARLTVSTRTSARPTTMAATKRAVPIVTAVIRRCVIPRLPSAARANASPA